MATMKIPEMNAVVQGSLAKIIGQICSRCHIGKDRSLFLGFGDVVRIKSAVGEAVHAKWEIGTYHNSWRVIQGGRLVCASQDVVDSVDDLRLSISQVALGTCLAIRQLSSLDVRIDFSNDLFVDILATVSDEDEVLHIFCPEKVVIIFSVKGGWAAGRSDVPWQ